MPPKEKTKGEAEVAAIAAVEAIAAAVKTESGTNFVKLVGVEDTNEAFVKALVAEAKKGASGDTSGFIVKVANARTAINELLGKTQIPLADTTQLDDLKKGIEGRITETAKEKKARLEAVKKELAELQVQIDEAEKPVKAELAALAPKYEEAFKPRKDAVEALVTKVKEIPAWDCAVATVSSVTVPNPIAPTQKPAIARTSTTTAGTGRGRAGAAGCRIKNISTGAERDFSSLNAARAAVYQEINNEPPKWQANAGSCLSYLQAHGYSVTMD